MNQKKVKEVTLMTEVLSWLLGIAWKLAVLYIGYTALKYVIRNGNRTFREILETIGMAIRVGCLRVRGKLVGQLRPWAKGDPSPGRNENRKNMTRRQPN